MFTRGVVPKDIYGTYFKNGPGYKVFKEHIWDRDGYLLSIGFKQGQVKVNSRAVQTKHTRHELKEQKMLYKRMFTSGKYDYLSFKNPGNVNVFFWDDKLLAAWGKGMPYEIDPFTLETKNETDLDGMLSPKVFAGQVKHCDGVSIGFSSSIHYNGCKFVIYENNPKCRKEFVLPGVEVPWIYDIQVTPNYYIIPVSGLKWISRDVSNMLWSEKSMAASVELDSSASLHIYVIPRSGGAGVMFKTDNRFIYHTINAYECEDKIVLDAITWDKFVYDEDTIKTVEKVWTRYLIDLDNEVISSENPKCPKNIEFPAINTRLSGHYYDTFFATGSEGEILKIHAHSRAPVQSWKPGIGGFCGQPCVLHDKYLLSVITFANKNTTDVVILDIDKFCPVATIQLPYQLPIGLHGNFVNKYFDS